jgi:Ser/Thr protein kinase RdoA (MazF antagonist)
VFHSLISHENRNAVKDLSPAKVENILAGLSTALDFDAARVRLFLDELRVSSLIHNDMHSRNIMKRDNGNYAFIDLDAMTFNIEGDIT